MTPSNRTDSLLKASFALMLCYRFLVPLFNNPLNHLASDPLRHWRNGQNLFNPSLMGSADPKAYQLYLWLVNLIAGQNHEAVALITGLLCASMALVWYGVCTELFSPRKALVLGTIIGLTPSLTSIYTVFMNESLYLVLQGASFWLTLKACRTKNVYTAKLAILFWILASYTRIIALPFMLISVCYMLFTIRKNYLQIIVFNLGVFIAFAIPASFHSYNKLNIIAPLGYTTALNKFYYYSNARTIHIHIDRGIAAFSSPSFYSNPFKPFFKFDYCRPNDIARIRVRTANGSKDWDAAIANAKKTYSLDKHLCALREDLVFFLFGTAWPDSSMNISYSKLYYANLTLRWLWLPLILLLLIRAPFIKRKPQELLVISCALACIFITIIQNTVPMEGRYRKPLEPLLLLTTAIILRRKSTDEDMTLWNFGCQTYVIPPAQYIASRASKIKIIN